MINELKKGAYYYKDNEKRFPSTLYEIVDKHDLYFTYREFSFGGPYDDLTVGEIKINHNSIETWPFFCEKLTEFTSDSLKNLILREAVSELLSDTSSKIKTASIMYKHFKESFSLDLSALDIENTIGVLENMGLFEQVTLIDGWKRVSGKAVNNDILSINAVCNLLLGVVNTTIFKEKKLNKEQLVSSFNAIKENQTTAIFFTKDNVAFVNLEWLYQNSQILEGII